MLPYRLDVAAMRRAYSDAGLAESDLAPDWVSQFKRWLGDAVRHGLPEPNAMVLATADIEGRPSARTVLLKGFDASGFVFFTNHNSRKGTDLAANPRASLVFPWNALTRQVVVIGDVMRITPAGTADYFNSRPRGSQLGAWASPQSSVIPGRAVLEQARDALAERYPSEVPVPPWWGGLRLAPLTVEFWQGRADRLHDRLRFRRADAGWLLERLAP